MSASASLHQFIEKYNLLQRPTEEINGCFSTHPNLHKIALVANHLFRAFAMTGMLMMMPFSPVVNTMSCLFGSLFYRLTVETNCAYKFALPAFAGSLAIPIGLPAMKDLIQGVAFQSLEVFAEACTSVLPLAAYLTYVILTVSYDVDKRRKN